MNVELKKLDGETPEEFDLFLRYAELGADRSIEALHRMIGIEGITAADLHELRARNLWDARVAEFDSWKPDQRDTWLQQVREQSKKYRIVTLFTLFRMVAENLELIDFSRMTVNQAVKALQILSQELRAELDDMPTHKTEIRKISQAEIESMQPDEVFALCMDMLNSGRNN